MDDMDARVLPRLVALTMAERLRAIPAPVVTAARHTGKCDLSWQLTPRTRP